MAHILLASSGLVAAAPANLAEALSKVEARLDAWASNTNAYNTLLQQVFAAAGTNAARWQQAAAMLQSSLLASGLGLRLELLTNAELPDINGGYTAQAFGGGERVYLNATWLQTASAEKVEAVLLEELAHAIDARLNGTSDSPGDEGERFSALLRGQEPSAASFLENDLRQLFVSSVAVEIEAADTTRPVANTTTPTFAAASVNPFGLGFGLGDFGVWVSSSFVDIDGDGDLDAFIGVSRSGNTLFFRNTGSPTMPAFAAPQTNPFGITRMGRGARPSFVDIDGDGDLDGFIDTNRRTPPPPRVPRFINAEIGFFRNTAAPGATAPAFAAAATNPFGLTIESRYSSSCFVDIDNDGDLDAFIGNVLGNTLFFRNTAGPGATDPAFAEAATNPFGLSNVSGSASPTFVDFDGDGDLDAFIGNISGTTRFFRNTAAPGATVPAFAAAATNPFGLSNVGGVASPSFVDIDADGDLDSFIGNVPGNIIFFRNTASTSVTPALGVSSTSPNGTYGVGALITLTLQFSEAVLVTGTPRLQLQTGRIDRFATFTGGSGTNTLRFSYTVQPGDSSADLDVVRNNALFVLSSDALSLNGGTIRDAAGNNAVLTLAAPGSEASLAARKNLVIDGIAPVAGYISTDFADGVANPFGLTNAAWRNARPELVDIDGDGDLDVFIGNYDGNLLFFRNTASPGSSIPAFALPVTNPFGIPSVRKNSSLSAVDIDGDGDLDAFIGADGGNTLFLRNTAALGTTTPAFGAASINPFGIRNVGFYAGPELVDIDSDGDLDAFFGTFIGDTLFFRNTAVAGSSEPRFAAPAINPFGLRNVGINTHPSFVDIDGDGDLDAFIGNNDGITRFYLNTAAQGSSTPAFAAPLNHPFGIDGVINVASPELDDIDGDGDLDAFIGDGHGNPIFFRNTAPALGVSSTTANGTYGAGALITLTVRFSEVVLVTGTPRLQLEIGSTDRFATYTSGSGTDTLSFAYIVQPGDSSADLEVLSAAALSLNGGTIKDAAGNSAVLTLAAPGSPASLAARKNLEIAGSPPVITAGPTAISATGFTLSVNVASTAALLKPDNTLLFSTPLAANTPTLLTVAAQAAVTTTTLVVTDLVGQRSTSATRVVLGTNSSDVITGSAAANFLYGFSGSDTLTGGDGNDTFIIETSGDLVVETNAVAATGGTDTVLSSLAAYTLAANVENLLLTGTAAINGTGNTLNNLITGNPGANSLNGAAGNDTLTGANGNDTYTIESIGDLVVETNPDAATGGIDTVLSSLAAYTLTDNVENLTLTGAAASNGTGNALNNRITGNANANVLNGGTGIDTLSGGDGNDAYVIDTAGDLVVETNTNAATGGIDRVVSSVVSYTLTDNVENLFLNSGAINGTGNSQSNRISGNAAANSLNGARGNDTLDGAAGNDTLNGGTGNDSLNGGNGSDLYVVDALGDLVVETNANPATGGIDTVISTLTTYALTANVENLTLKGSGYNGTGNDLDNRITGNAASNILNGGSGNDTLTGANGNDFYFVDAFGDLVVETNPDAATGGIDRVLSSLARYTLTPHVENLTLIGNGAISGTGNRLDNVIAGNDAANLLKGAYGSDTIDGGAGNDTLDGGYGADSLNGGSGIDTADYRFYNGVLVANLATGVVSFPGNSVLIDSLTNIENLLAGGGNDLLTGSNLNNLLSGGAGNDTLNGSTGNDTLTGGLGADTFRFDAPLNATTNRDVITDFSLAQGDLIQLENSVFTSLTTTGTLADDAFTIGASATSADHRLLYNSATGLLAFDSDGNGAAAAIAFATLSPGLGLTNASFTVS